MNISRVLVLIFSLSSASAIANAKLAYPVNNPVNGRVCFFAEANFSGQSFCMPVGAQEADLVPSGWNDRISSILIEGKALVSVYRDVNYGGSHITFRKSVADLASVRGDWNDEISGFVASGVKR